MKSQFSHLIDASYIRNKYRRQTVSSHIKIFDISEFGINKEAFLKELSISFDGLPWDMYDVGFKVERIIKEKYPLIFEYNEKEWLGLWSSIGREMKDKEKLVSFWINLIDPPRQDLTDEIRVISPHRRRSCYSYTVQKKTGHFWEIKEEGAPVFTQSVDDGRSRSRIFGIPNAEIIRNENILKLIAYISEIISFNPNVKVEKLRVTFHQMLTYAKGIGYNQPAPEGVHQDGSPFIVSAIVIERTNVKGGVSRIFYNKPDNANYEKALAIEKILQPGEGIFQADMFTNYWHGISNISKVSQDLEGYRSIIGFDIEFI